MNIENVKTEIIKNYEELTKINQDINKTNDQIIEAQKKHIIVLENYIKELKEIIQNYILKDVKL